MSFFATGVGLLVDLLQVVAGIVGAVLVGTRVRPPVQVPAVLGCGLLALAGAVAATSRFAFAAVAGLGVDYNLLSTFVSLSYGLPATAGIVLLVRAVLLASRPTAPPSHPVDVRGSSYQGPWQA